MSVSGPPVEGVDQEVEAREPSDLPPSGWCHDPAHLHDQRCWDGESWSAWVTDRNEVGEDPIPGLTWRPPVAALPPAHSLGRRGWYPDPDRPWRERRWDGHRWTPEWRWARRQRTPKWRGARKSRSANSRPPGWFRDPIRFGSTCYDPAHAHEWRWWDGSSWSAWVADGGQVGEDPIEGRLPPPPVRAVLPHRGWYPDPDDPLRKRRRWDGDQWTPEGRRVRTPRRPHRLSDPASGVLIALGLSMAYFAAVGGWAFTTTQLFTDSKGQPVPSGPFWPVPVMAGIAFLLVLAGVTRELLSRRRSKRAAGGATSDPAVVAQGPRLAYATLLDVVGLAAGLSAYCSGLVFWCFVAYSMVYPNATPPDWAGKTLFVSLAGAPCSVVAILLGLVGLLHNPRNRYAWAAIALGIAAIFVFFVGFLFGAASM